MEKCLKLVKNAVELDGEVTLTHDAEIAKISVAGIGLRSHTGVGEKMFRTLSDHNINILLVGTSEMRMTAVINKSQANAAEKALCEMFLGPEI
ncbi:MAG TPA: hypothetical protein DD473_19530 [Planctomycetaceae bacterium]|nr:hypothetical protein [Planctomycetaceae bacterium]